MKLISWDWINYVLVGFIMGASAVIIWHFLKKYKLKLVWHEWILLLLSFITFLFMSQTFIASFYEFEPKAAWFSLLFMGIPLLLMVTIVFRSLKKRYVKNEEIE